MPPTKRTTPRVPNTTIYLGVPEETKRRKAALDEIATSLGLKGRSELIQKLADGEIKVCKGQETARK